MFVARLWARRPKSVIDCPFVVPDEFEDDSSSHAPTLRARPTVPMIGLSKIFSVARSEMRAQKVHEA